MDPLLDVKDIECRYEDRPVVEGLTMHVNEGSIACLLGPSGCGKTTVLRAIAGFEPLRHGEIRVSGKVISRPGYTLAPDKRKLGMVFQDYALFPHMNVCANITFGLRGLTKIATIHDDFEDSVACAFRPLCRPASFIKPGENFSAETEKRR